MNPSGNFLAPLVKSCLKNHNSLIYFIYKNHYSFADNVQTDSSLLYLNKAFDVFKLSLPP